MSPNPFDLRYEQLRSPTGTVEYGLTKTMAELLLSQNPDGFRKNVEEIAKNNDIQSLTVAMQLVKKMRDATQNGNPNSTGEIAIPPEFVYCVTHMLVDGAGNEAFARTWLETFEHTPFKAGECYRRNRNRETRSLVNIQKRLGLASLGNVFQSHELNPTRPAPFITVILEAAAANLSVNGQENLRNEVAAVLRMLSPDQLPELEVKLGTKSPAADVMWGNMFMAPVMASIADAYQSQGVRNAAVQAQMSQSLERALGMANTVRLSTGTRWEYHWDAIAQWADEGTPEQLWKGIFAVPYWTKDKNGAMSQRFQTGGFNEAIQQGSRESSLLIAETMHRLGFDLNRESRETRDNGEVFGRRLIDVAGDSLNPDLLGYLVSIGIDPDVPSYEAPGNVTKPKTAIERFEAHRNVSSPEAMDRLNKADMILRSWSAKKEADLTLKEMMSPQETARAFL